MSMTRSQWRWRHVTCWRSTDSTGRIHPSSVASFAVLASRAFTPVLNHRRACIEVERKERRIVVLFLETLDPL